ncbi:MAG: TolC family protein [Bacteroidales bacterium]|nr:TolC family protein [Bacteroidales bacterium]
MKITGLIVALMLVAVSAANAAEPAKVMRLDLQKVIQMATDSSLTAFRYKNLYLSDYWSYRRYRAERLPSLSLTVNPVTYNRQIVSRYDYDNDRDVFRQQKSYSASGQLTLSQNFSPVGGTFFVESDLTFMRSFGASTYNQFSAVPIQIGYYNNMFGYNEFKWNKKIEPLKYERAKLEYLYNTENIAYLAVTYFFTLAQAQSQYRNALEQAANSDSLLVMGERRYKIASITKSDLMSLKLDVVNARNTIISAEVQMKRASLALASFLGIDSDTQMELELPGAPGSINIDTEKALDMMHKNSYLILEKMQNVSEAEKALDKIKKSTRFNANVNATVGFNQQAEELSHAYDDPKRRDVISVTLSIPLLDWGVGKGQRNYYKNNLNIARIDEQQKIMELEQNVIITVSELQSRLNMLTSAEEALVLANEVYKENVVRFRNGTCDITTLSSSQQRLQTAQNNYISSMDQYWQCYYDLRRQTLYDFQLDFSLSDEFDFNNLK